jgi:hypothetical protein
MRPMPLSTMQLFKNLDSCEVLVVICYQIINKSLDRKRAIQPGASPKKDAFLIYLMCRNRPPILS